MPLYLDLRVGESVDIDNGRVVVTLHEKSGQRARLAFDADKSVHIERVKPMRHIAAMGITQPAIAQ